MKVMQKYFLAIVPTGVIQEKATALKLELKEKFNVKYALKSPAHVTLKMPFSYNESKESILIEKLSTFLADQKGFPIQVSGTATFGKRVIFWKINAENELYELQAALKIFCKRELNFVDELSDRNYHPHMTIAFKDLKERDFEKVLDLITLREIDQEYQVNEIVLLKRKDGRWENFHSFKLSDPS